MYKIDACGLSCPEPVMLLSDAITKHTNITITLDSLSAFNSCQNFIKSKNLSYTTNENNDTFEIVINE